MKLVKLIVSTYVHTAQEELMASPIITVILRIPRWSYELQDVFLKRKKKVLKKLCFKLKKSKLETYLVVYDECPTKIKLNRY